MSVTLPRRAWLAVRGEELRAPSPTSLDAFWQPATDECGAMSNLAEPYNDRVIFRWVLEPARPTIRQRERPPLLGGLNDSLGAVTDITHPRYANGV